MPPTLLDRGVKPDDRNRLALGKALASHRAGTVYDVYEDEHGRIILDPQVLVPARETWLYKNQKALRSVKRGLSQLGKKSGKSLGSFAKYADDAA